MRAIPGLGVRGAALAIVIGRSSTFLVAPYALVLRERLLTARIPRLREIWFSWRETLHVGVPNAGAKMIIPLGQGIITRVVASYGAGAVAGFGVATRLEFFSLASLNTLSSVIGPFVGQNIGARKFDRVRTGVTTNRQFSRSVGHGLFFVYLLFAGNIAALFNKDPMVISTTALYLRLYRSPTLLKVSILW